MNRDYTKISFHNTESIERYEQYGASNPDMPADEVVWRVNNNLDKKKYEFDVPVSGYDDPCIIVNKYFRLSDDYCPPDLVEEDGRIMRKAVREAYIKMRDTAKEEGFTISVSSAYRSAGEQRRIYEKRLESSTVKEVDEFCARPGYSEHQTGMALDIQGRIPGGQNISKTPEAKWLKDNCHRFGFILRYLPEIVEITGYESEPWHIRYVGVDISTDMKEKNILSFEEYRERFKNDIYNSNNEE